MTIDKLRELILQAETDPLWVLASHLYHSHNMRESDVLRYCGALKDISDVPKIKLLNYMRDIEISNR